MLKKAIQKKKKLRRVVNVTIPLIFLKKMYLKKKKCAMTQQKTILNFI